MKQNTPKVSDVLGVSLIVLAVMELLFWMLSGFLDRSVPSVFLHFLLQLPVYLIPLFVVLFAYRRLGIRAPRLPRGLGYNQSAMLTVSTFGGIVILQLLYASVFPSTVPVAGVEGVRSAFTLLLLSFSSVALPALLDEVFFRAVVLRSLTVYRALLAILISSLANALLDFSLEAFPIRFFCAFLIGSLYYATGSLAVSVGVHILANAVWFLAETVAAFASDYYSLFMRVLVCACVLLLAFGLPFLKQTVRAILADEDDDGVLPSAHFWGIPIAVFLILAVSMQLLVGTF